MTTNPINDYAMFLCLVFYVIMNWTPIWYLCAYNSHGQIFIHKMHACKQ